MPNLLPEKDFHAWALNAAQRARAGLLTAEELEEVAEELEDIAKSERRELEGRLVVLLSHLLKWRYQPDRQGKSWRTTIKEQRIAIMYRMKDSPSLKPKLQDVGAQSYLRAVQRAARETDLEENDFPATFEKTGWTWEEVLNEEYFP